jgi:NAD(P)-dependent dehydrogenase (short-subunit alcohol dehydrogenase family)
MKLLDERVAVIISSTKGNGRAMANLFSEHGANVIVTGRDKNEAENIANQLAIAYQTNSLGLKVVIEVFLKLKCGVPHTIFNIEQIFHHTEFLK